MDSFKHKTPQAFQLEGRFLGFTGESSFKKLKYIRLATALGEQRIKLSKELRPMLYGRLTPGEWIRVTGYQKVDAENGTRKLKAEQIVYALPSSALEQPALLEKPALREEPVSREWPSQGDEKRTIAKSACILICQKSDCCKRGSRQVAQALQTELSDRGLADQVTIKPTGCMKRCKEGANVVMPDKSRYTRVHPKGISALVDQHFPETALAPAKTSEASVEAKTA